MKSSLGVKNFYKNAAGVVICVAVGMFTGLYFLFGALAIVGILMTLVTLIRYLINSGHELPH